MLEIVCESFLPSIRLSLNFFFFSCSSIIFSLIVPLVISLITVTFFVCPILCALSVAWFSACGFHQIARCITISALVKLSPVPSDLSVIKKQLVLYCRQR